MHHSIAHRQRPQSAGALRFVGMLALLSAGPAGATDYLWFGNNPTLGGAGTWGGSNQTTNGRWRVDANGDGLADNPTDLPWTGAMPSIDFATARAVFEGNGAAVTLSSGLTLQTNALLFKTGGYTIVPGSSTSRLNLMGAAPTITVDAAPPSSATIGAVVTGTAGLAKRGSGTLTLTGASTYTGTTAIEAGTLRVGAGGTTGAVATSSAVAVAEGATLEISRSNSVVFANQIGGAGGLTKSGSGTTTLTGANTFTGSATIAAGTLQVGNNGTAGTLGSGAVSVAAGARLTINRSDATTIANAIGGAGNLTKLRTATTTLTGANSYTGTTTVGAGTLQVGAGGTAGALGSGTVSVASGATLAFNRSDAVTVGNTISGAGGRLAQVGTGTTVLTGINSYTGMTTITAGTLSVSTIGNGGSSGNLGAASSSAANLVLSGGALQYTGATATTNRSFTLSTGTTSMIEVANSGTTLTLSGAGAATSGSLTKTGAGALVLSGNNQYTGTTTVRAGTLALGASNRLANASALVVNGGTFALGSYSDTVARLTLNSGSISGSGMLTATSGHSVWSGSVNSVLGGAGLAKEGGGTVVLAGANTYTGATTINAGTLVVNGSLVQASAVTVNPDGLLAGTGRVNGTVALSGRLSPGSVALDGVASIGTLTTGAQTWNAGSGYVWQINNALGTAGTAWDRVLVAGALQIGATSAAPFTLQVIGLDAAGGAGVLQNFSNTSSYSWSLLTADSFTGFNSGAFVVDAAAFAANNPLGGGSFSITQAGNSLDLVFTPVPEPKTYALLLGALTLAVVAVRNWRRRRAVAA